MSAGLAPALAGALARLDASIAAERIDRVWLFPPRRLGAGESHLAVLSLFDPGNAERRDILTLHAVASVDGRAQSFEEVVEQGSVPEQRIERLIVGVLQRLKDDREVPRGEIIAGDRARWSALLAGVPLPT